MKPMFLIRTVGGSCKLSVCIVVLCTMALRPALAQDNASTQLAQKATALYKSGDYAQAAIVATQDLELVQKSRGPEHPEVARSLVRLASIYFAQGKYSLAEPLYRQALSIDEKNLGLEHPDVANDLNNLGSIYRSQGRFAEAERVLQRALAVREKIYGAENPNVALSLRGLAIAYEGQGNYKEAEALYRRSLTIQEKNVGPDRPEIADLLTDLAILFKAQGKYAQAEPLFQRALPVYEKAFGPEHRNVALTLSQLASLYVAQGKYTVAGPLYKRALAIQEKVFGPEHPDVARSLSSLAELYRNQGQYSLAEPLYKRALSIREKVFGWDSLDVANSLYGLAALFGSQGKYAQAETLYKSCLAIQEKHLGAQHTSVAGSLDQLADIYRVQGKYALAEPLHKRALAIYENSLGPDHPELAISLSQLAALYFGQGKYSIAEALYKRALAINEKAFGAEHSNVAMTLLSLANLYQAQGQYAYAEQFSQRALTIQEKALGMEHPTVANCLHTLALIYVKQEKYEPAERLYQRAIAIREKVLGGEHPQLAGNLKDLATLYEKQGRYEQALATIQRASSIFYQRIVNAGFDDSARQEAAAARSIFSLHLSLLIRNPGKYASANVINHALLIQQLAQSSGTSSAIAKMAARFASGNDALAELAKRKQDLAEQYSRVDEQLVSAASLPPEKRDAAAEQRLRQLASETARQMQTVNVELTRRFPQYQELVHHEPLKIEKIQRLLRTGEAMLVYSLGAGNYVWVITPMKSSFRILPINVGLISAQVAKVRSQMEFDDKGRAPKVSVDMLHDLYKNLFAPIVPHLAGVTHLIVVPSGPLQSLPMGMLVSAPPPGIDSDADYRKVQWLVNDYAFSVLPSVSSIQAFRQFAKTDQAPQPFAGFGDPLIGTDAGVDRGVRVKLDVSAVYRGLGPDKSNRAARKSGSEIADVEFIRHAPRLPETADELRMMASTMKSGPESLWLQAQANETRVKSMDLSRYRILAFATHGVLAGEIDGIGEPGLVLTPPATGTPEDDGYLSASEIARLKLNADWVLLSACNTAAPDGTPGAEGLSGMAKAFFYAGARSLLVSHWRVASEATTSLTTMMLQEFESRPETGKAQAQRRAIVSLMNTPKHPEYAHPLFWAPFVVVGEGGSDLRGK